MRTGSGTLAATVAASAGSLGFERVGGIVRNRVRPAVPSLFIVFGKSNEALNQMVASLPLVSASVGPTAARSDAGREQTRRRYGS